MSDDEDRIRAYLRKRADVSVPDDLQWPTAASERRRRWSVRSGVAWARLAAAGLVVAAVVVGASLGLAAPSSGPAHSSTPSPGGSPQSTIQPAGSPFPMAGPPFPSEVAGLSGVAGLPVMSVASASELLSSGGLDGQAVAVGGYFDQMYPPCPYPGRYIGPLESWCRFVAFTDARATAQLCRPDGSNGSSCSLPTGTNLAPFFMSETSGDASSRLPPAGAAGEPAAVVLIGHAGDARQWLCTATTQAECASAFVVDRVAWAEGHDVPVTAPETADQQTGKAITARMTLDQVAALIGPGNDLLTAAPFRAGDIATIDPRWNLAGDNVVWLLRSVEAVTASNAGQTRPEVVWLVDDATGTIIDGHALDATYQPARLWQMATAHGVGCCAGDVLAFYRVTSRDGTVVYDGVVRGGSSGGTDSTTYGGGYGSEPLALPAGDYALQAWLAPYVGSVMGTPRDECSTQVTLGPLDDVALNADFPPNQACTFRPAPSPSPGS